MIDDKYCNSPQSNCNISGLRKNLFPSTKTTDGRTGTGVQTGKRKSKLRLSRNLHDPHDRHDQHMHHDKGRQRFSSLKRGATVVNREDFEI